MPAGRWISSHVGHHPGHDAVVGGHDIGGERIYIARAHYKGNLIPGKSIPDKHLAYVSYGGWEIPIHNFEVLTGHGYSWAHGSYGNVPPGAVVGGHTSSGEKLYIGRVRYKGSITTGKVHPSCECLFIPFGNSEVYFKSYEVLVKD